MNNIKQNKKFLKIGSAHSIKEIKIKEKQGVKLLFLSSIFKNNKDKKFLGCVKFNNLANQTTLKIIALGGINKKNMSKLKITKAYGFASISLFETNYKLQKKF
jgi:thiamine-phosphate pyrophosphorylase